MTKAQFTGAHVNELGRGALERKVWSTATEAGVSEAQVYDLVRAHFGREHLAALTDAQVYVLMNKVSNAGLDRRMADPEYANRMQKRLNRL